MSSIASNDSKILHFKEQPPRSQTPSSTPLNTTRSSGNQENRQHLANAAANPRSQTPEPQRPRTTYSDFYSTTNQSQTKPAGTSSTKDNGSAQSSAAAAKSVIVIDAHRSHNAIFNFGSNFIPAQGSRPSSATPRKSTEQTASPKEDPRSFVPRLMIPTSSQPKLTRSQSVESLRIESARSNRSNHVTEEIPQQTYEPVVDSQSSGIPRRPPNWTLGLDASVPYRPSKKMHQPPKFSKDPKVIWDHYRTDEFRSTVKMVPRRGSGLNSALEVKPGSPSKRRPSAWNQSQDVLRPECLVDSPPKLCIKTYTDVGATIQSEGEWTLGNRPKLGIDHGNVIADPPLEVDPYSRRLILAPDDHDIVSILKYRNGGKLADETEKLIYNQRKDEKEAYTTKMYETAHRVSHERAELFQKRYAYELAKQIL
eukprot:TRINITY_DN9766_c0_g1_i2.p1 TRINITY_DN9766_c0_g1~~TRINITY_DN9766_c0_g1_i2.p1  ORF type:complete len:424 (+),score=79.00 TRINITY_DN9766_c0_g1_i2:63-1334(+)